jgi:hypothetical protein|tara:strand:+ start:759 stop:971 length:213 start_codon:yes stop_codon:yes gene_type:complete
MSQRNEDILDMYDSCCYTYKDIALLHDLSIHRARMIVLATREKRKYKDNIKKSMAKMTAKGLVERGANKE